MDVLVITNLFPNRIEPTRGMYNKQEISDLSKLCELKVVAPVPWSPPIKVNKKWYLFSQILKRETIDGIDVYHPRYFMIPKFGRSLYGFYFFISLLEKVRKYYESFKFDLIYALWAYPDGFGSFLISKVMKKPIVIKALGSDINITTQYFLCRKMIVFALKNCNKVIAVSNALKEKMIKIGVHAEKIVVIPNGIDLNLFKPMDQAKCRKILELPLVEKIVLFIGNLVPAKGLDYLIEAFSSISSQDQDLFLVIIGDGYLGEKLIRKVKNLGLEKKVKFVGRRSHNEIPLWMNACDVFCLPSLNEGCPNVVLEALACGKPVVATKVGGIPEIITSEDYGILVPSQDPKALAETIHKALQKEWNPEEICEKVSNQNWATNAKKIYEELHLILKKKERIFPNTDSFQNVRNCIRSDRKTYIIITVDTEFSSHKDDIGIFGSINGKEYGISKIMDICDRHNVKTTFFVDVYGYKKVGEEVMKSICLQIYKRGYDVQLHTHPDQIYDKNKGYMAKYSLGEQIEIIKHGKALLEDWVGESPIAHRAGDWGASDDTIRALEINNIPVDSSAFEGWPFCKLNLSIKNKVNLLGGILEIAPTTYISPSLGLFRPYKIIDIDANPFLELKAIIQKCKFYNINPIVIVLHSFSFLIWNRIRTEYRPDYSDIKKFNLLIQWLKQDRQIHILTMKDFYFSYKQKRISEDLSSGIIPSSGLFLSLYRVFDRVSKRKRELLGQ